MSEWVLRIVNGLFDPGRVSKWYKATIQGWSCWRVLSGSWSVVSPHGAAI